MRSTATSCYGLLLLALLLLLLRLELFLLRLEPRAEKLHWVITVGNGYHEIVTVITLWGLASFDVASPFWGEASVVRQIKGSPGKHFIA